MALKDDRVEQMTGLNMSTFIYTRFNENPFTIQCEKKDKKAEGFQISPFYWPFSSDIMAVKGLNCRVGYTSCSALVGSPPRENVLMQQWSTL